MGCNPKPNLSKSHRRTHPFFSLDFLTVQANNWVFQLFENIYLRGDGWGEDILASTYYKWPQSFPLKAISPIHRTKLHLNISISTCSISAVKQSRQIFDSQTNIFLFLHTEGDLISLSFLGKKTQNRNLLTTGLCFRVRKTVSPTYAKNGRDWKHAQQYRMWNAVLCSETHPYETGSVISEAPGWSDIKAGRSGVKCSQLSSRSAFSHIS